MIVLCNLSLGFFSFDKPWVKSLLLRMGYVKRRGSKLPVNEFEKGKFPQKVYSAVDEHKIPPKFVFNVHLIPVSCVKLDDGEER